MDGAPYQAALRLCEWWAACEADVSGRCARQGISLEAEPLVTALDIVFSLMLDECEGSRQEARERIEAALCEPTDPGEHADYQAQLAQERWEQRALAETQGAQAIEQARARDQMFAAVSYE